MEIIFSHFLDFLRISAYFYVAFVGYISFKENNKDKKMMALLVGNVLMSSSLIFCLLARIFYSGTIMTYIISVALTPVSIFWAMTHFYSHFKK